MPLVRVEVRNEYALGVPELYREANKEDPKEILEGVSVAGLVGVLRQLGDLAEFAAEVFHGLQEEVMIISSRSNKLTGRVQRIEAALSPLEKAVLAQRSHLHFAYTSGSNWHSRILCEQNHFVSSDVPQFIMDSYEDCHVPPRLHLLDRFDPGGPGSCLKKYSDPTFFKRTSGASGEVNTEKISKHKKARKIKKRTWSRNGEVSRGASFSNCSDRMHFTQLNVGGHSSPSQTASTYDTALRSDLGEQPKLDSRNRSDYIVGDIDSNYSIRPEEQESRASISSTTMRRDSDFLDFNFLEEKVADADDDNQINSSLDQAGCSSSSVTWDENKETVEPTAREYEPNGTIQEGDNGSNIESETDHFMDALNTIESESVTDIDCTKNKEEEHGSNLEDKAADNGPYELIRNNSACRSSNTESNVLASSYLINGSSCGQNTIDSGISVDYTKNKEEGHCANMEDTAVDNGLHGPIRDTSESQYSNSESNELANSSSGMQIIDRKRSSPESNKPAPEASNATSVMFWTNGNLLGLQPSKPPECAVNPLPQEHEKISNSNQSGSLHSFKNGPDRDWSTHQENHESNTSFRKTSWKISPTDLDIKLGKNGDSSLYQNNANSSHQAARTFEQKSRKNASYRTFSPSASPPLEHMKISFQPIDGFFETSKLKLKFPDGNYNSESGRDIFPSFQLVPEATITRHNFGSESDDDDTFCGSSPSLVDDCVCHQSDSNSDQWESVESHGSKGNDLYDALRRISFTESVSTGNALVQNGFQNSRNHSSNGELTKDANSRNLKPPFTPTPATPPMPPVQWMGIKPHINNTEEKCDAIPEGSNFALDLKVSKSTVSQQPKPDPLHDYQTIETADIQKSKTSGFQKSSGRREANPRKSMDDMDFLQQIRTRSFNLRPTATTKPTFASGVPAKVQVTAILEKANAVRQAVGSDNGEEDSNWSDA